MSGRLVVLVSGSGSNLQALMDACATQRLDAHVCGVVSDKEDAYGLVRAQRGGLPHRALPFRVRSGESRTEARMRYDARLADVVDGFKPDLVVLAGFMRILGAPFLSRFPGRLINLHPALPGQLPGTKAIERALARFHDTGLRHTGVMVHHVVPEVDAGPVIAQREVLILAEDTLETLSARMHEVEHEVLVQAVGLVLKDLEPVDPN